MQKKLSGRVFKTARFGKDAKRARIPDADLCDAVRQIMAGQADDLGGGVFKKRLRNNEYRSIVLAKGGRYWIFEYLFAKKNQDNIDTDELAAFRQLAKAYTGLNETQVVQLLHSNHWVEICHDNET